MPLWVYPKAYLFVVNEEKRLITGDAPTSSDGATGGSGELFMIKAGNEVG
jgi:hypothetical protein